MTLPGLLIIGGMKCGSTTLFRDLSSHNLVFCPDDKEPESLTSDHVLGGQGQMDYERLFRKAGPGQICAEASTAYTKLPDYHGVPSRARKLLGPELRIIYVVRDPVERASSHHHHDLHTGQCRVASLESALGAYSPLLDYSRYGMQLAPWLDTFAADQIRVILFEEYIRARQTTCDQLWSWLGLPVGEARVDETVMHNGSQGKPVHSGPFASLPDHPVYRKLIRPFTSPRVRDLVKRTLYKERAAARDKPSTLAREMIQSALSEDIRRFDDMYRTCGLSRSVPSALWGFGHGGSLP